MQMPGFISDTPLARDLIRIDDEAIDREDDAALRAYFADDYVSPSSASPRQSLSGSSARRTPSGDEVSRAAES